jgi:CheY-like chemotaxis protein
MTGWLRNKQEPDIHEQAFNPVEVSQLRILVVDDNEDAALSLSMLLELSGHLVRTAYDGAEALRQVTDFAPRVVLLDLGMPRMDGYEVCHKLRQLPGGQNITVIAATGWGQEEDRRKTEEAGFDMHMVKPLDTEVLRATLEAIA